MAEFDLSGQIGEYPFKEELQQKYGTRGGCLEEALRQAGYEVKGIPEFPEEDVASKTAKRLGLRVVENRENYHYKARRKLIVCHESIGAADPRIYHATFINSTESWNKLLKELEKDHREIKGILEIPK